MKTKYECYDADYNYFDEGYNACEEGLTQDKNPCNQENNCQGWEEWNDGWERGENDETERMNEYCCGGADWPRHSVKIEVVIYGKKRIMQVSFAWVDYSGIYYKAEEPYPDNITIKSIETVEPVIKETEVDEDEGYEEDEDELKDFDMLPEEVQKEILEAISQEFGG